VTDQSPVRWGVLGAANIALKKVIPAMQRGRLSRVVAIASRDLAKARAAAEALGIERAYGSYEELLADQDVEVVYNPLPNHLHVPWSIRAANAGKHVLCEKPIALSASEARELLAARDRTGVQIAEAFMVRTHPQWVAARELVASGRIGDLRLVSGHFSYYHRDPADIRSRAEFGGGAMMDIGIHMTDLARYFLGEITSVYGSMSESVWHVDGSEDNAIAIFKNPDGIVASYQTTWDEWKGYKSYVEIYGDNGMVRAAYAAMSNLLIANTTKGKKFKVRKLYPEIILREKFRSWQTTALLSFQEELNGFLKMIGGDYDVALADGHAGLRSVEVSEAVRQSSKTGQAVELPNIGRMYGA